MYGTIFSYDPQTGIGWVDSAGMKPERLPFLIDTLRNPRGFVPGERVSYSIGTRAVAIEADHTSFGLNTTVGGEGKPQHPSR